LASWNRLADNVKLKTSLPKLEKSILDLFIWASGPTADPKGLVDWLVSVTLWDPLDISALIWAPHFNLLQPSDFRNEINLIKL
jgi:hypothetical protein